jgi:hypothetical protein
VWVLELTQKNYKKARKINYLKNLSGVSAGEQMAGGGGAFEPNFDMASKGYLEICNNYTGKPRKNSSNGGDRDLDEER